MSPTWITLLANLVLRQVRPPKSRNISLEKRVSTATTHKKTCPQATVIPQICSKSQPTSAEESVSLSHVLAELTARQLNSRDRKEHDDQQDS